MHVAFPLSASNKHKSFLLSHLFLISNQLLTSHSYKEFVTQKYGEKTYGNIITYQEKTRQLKLLEQDIKFLNSCKKSNVVPTHCKFGGRRGASTATKRLLRKYRKEVTK